MKLLTIPTDTNAIEMFMHCGRCLDDRPDDVSPRDWAALEIGATADGLQVWCKRHERSVVHIIGFAPDDQEADEGDDEGVEEGDGPFYVQSQDHGRYLHLWVAATMGLIDQHDIFDRPERVEHINGDTLDNRRANLRLRA